MVLIVSECVTPEPDLHMPSPPPPPLPPPLPVLLTVPSLPPTLVFIVDDIDGTSLVPGHHSSKSVIIGGPGAWTPFPSHSFLSYLGPKVSA